MTITAHFSFHLDPTQLEHAYEVIHDSLAATRAFPGNIGVEAWIDNNDPSHMLLIETWESIEADTAYRTWRRSDGTPKESYALFVGTSELTFYSVNPAI
ncbi:hypothetical protein BH09ACT10_BH09ACT10_20090 [soil metagenome]